MSIRDHLGAERLTGYVTVRSGDVEVRGKNLVVYNGGDIIAALLAGKPNYKISAFYFEYENTAGTPSAAAVDRSDTAADRQAVTTPKDLLRAQLVAAPLIESADDNHLGNQVTFHAVTSATTGLNGLPFSAGADSKVYAVCLVATPTPGTPADDLLYARFLLDTALPVSGSGSVAGSWVTTAD